MTDENLIAEASRRLADEAPDAKVILSARTPHAVLGEAVAGSLEG